MNKILNYLLILPAFAAVLSSSPSIRASEAIYRPATDKPASILIEGTSNVHDWEVEGKRIDGEVVLPAEVQGDGMFHLQTAFMNGNARAIASVPVKSLVGSKRGMDGRMQAALQADRHETINFVLRDIKVSEEQATDGQGLQAQALGDLTIAGSTRPASFEVTISGDDTRLQIEGRTVLDMTDFGVEPPRALLGALRTGDEVTVTFAWNLLKAQVRE